MKKLTRKTFSRKFVAIGLSSFLGVGLVSTGFAAWVMSSNATDDVESNVTVATLSDISMSFSNVAVKDNASIIFGAAKDDNQGRLISDGVDDACLEIFITGTINNAMQLGVLTAELKLPEQIKNAITAGYIVAPESAQSGGVTLYDAVTPTQSDDIQMSFSGENNNTVTFTYKLSFAWGEKFGGMNPSHYYDIDPTGKEISNSDMSTQMQEFHSTISGTADGSTKTLAYTLTLTATANTSV